MSTTCDGVESYTWKCPTRKYIVVCIVGVWMGVVLFISKGTG